MREIKFQFLFKGLPYSSMSEGFNWHKKVYSLGELVAARLDELCHTPSLGELIAKRQFTGLKDKNGIEIYEGDIINCEVNCLFVGGRINKQVVFEGCGFKVGGVSLEIIVDSFMPIVFGNFYQNPELLESK